MKAEFKKMTDEQKNNIYAGSAWWVAVIPFVLQAIISAVASIKMLATDNGSIKYKGFQSSWSQNKSSASKGVVKQYFYDI